MNRPGFSNIILTLMAVFLLSNCASATNEVERRNEPTTTPEIVPSLIPTFTAEPVQATPTEILISGSPINWVPKLDGIPTDMHLSEDGTQTNEEVAAGETDPTEALKMLELMEEWGRKESYYQVYSPEDQCRSKTGLYEVRIFVVSFKTAAGAEESRVWRLANTTATHQEATKDFGESANLYGWIENSDCVPSQVIYESAVFRRYNAIVNVDVGSIEDVANINDMQTLATYLAEKIDMSLKDAVK